MNSSKPPNHRFWDWLLIALGVLIFVLLSLLMLIPCFQGMGA
jgi:hypothetical protein